MQFKCPPGNASNDSSASTLTTAFPDTKQCDRKCCHESTTAASTTCQPKTSEWPSPPAPPQPLRCDFEPLNDTDCWVKEERDDDPCYRSPQRSNRLFSPVIPTKPKQRRKREKKGTGTSGKPTTPIKSLQDDETGYTAGSGGGGGVAAGTAKPTASKSSPTTNKTTTTTSSGGVEAVTGAKSKSPKTSPRATTTRKPTSPNVLYLKRRSNKKTAIDWRNPPKIPIKHTATSKARNENWFADCGRYRVKAYRGDWDNLPDELSADYELYERFFKHRKPVVKKNTSLVKKLVQGKINLQKPRIENKPFRKRSPVLPTAGEKPKRKSKLKSSFRFDGVRGSRIVLRKQPLIQVRHTLTSSMRRHLDGHSCEKSPMPTYWHGSVEEMEQLKKKIDQRRGQLRNYWKKNDDQQQRQRRPQQQRQQRQPREKPSSSDSTNDLVVASSNPSTVLAAKAYRKTEKQTKPVNAVKYRESKDSSPQPPSPHPAKPTADEVRNFRKAIAIKVLPASESVVVSGHDRRRRRHHREPQTSANAISNDCDANADTEKWMQPPAIPIRYSLTAIMRRRSTNKFSRNTVEGAANIIRVAR